MIVHSFVKVVWLPYIVRNFVKSKTGSRNIDPFVQLSRPNDSVRFFVLCSLENLKQLRLAHPQDHSTDNRELDDIGDLSRYQFLLRALVQARVYRDEIRRSICSQGLDSSLVLIEFDLESYPWTWSVSEQASSNRLPQYLLRVLVSRDQKFKEQDTMLAVICPYSHSHSVYFARPILRNALLDQTHVSSDDFLCSLDNVLLRWL